MADPAVLDESEIDVINVAAGRYQSFVSPISTLNPWTASYQTKPRPLRLGLCRTQKYTHHFFILTFFAVHLIITANLDLFPTANVLAANLISNLRRGQRPTSHPWRPCTPFIFPKPRDCRLRNGSWLDGETGIGEAPSQDRVGDNTILAFGLGGREHVA